ncbi:hypothetical protein WJ978_23415 [Achromobacter xylosoxidans]
MAQLAAQQCGKVPPAAWGETWPAAWTGVAATASTSSSATTRGPLAVQRMTDEAPCPAAAGRAAPSAVAATSDWKTSSPAASHTSARLVAADLRVNVTGVCIPMVPTSLRRPPDARNFNPTRHNCYAPRFQHLNSQHTMGLEQLAAIRELLLKQAPEEAASRRNPPVRPPTKRGRASPPRVRPAMRLPPGKSPRARRPANDAKRRRSIRC